LKKIFTILIILIYSFFGYSQKIDSLKLLIKNEKNNLNNVDLLIQLSSQYKGVSVDSALLFAEQALEIAKKTEDLQLIINSLHNLGKITQTNSLNDKSITFYKESIEYSEKLGNDSLIAFSHHKLGNVYFGISRNEEALEQYIIALEIRSKINDIEGIAATTNNIGSIYWDKEKLELAINYYKISLENEQKIDNKKGIATSLNNIGLVFWKGIEFDSALIYLNKSIDIKLAIGDELGCAKSYVNVGIIYRTLGIRNLKKDQNIFKIEKNNRKNFDLAVSYFLKGIEIFIKFDIKKNLANAYNNLGDSYYYLNQYVMALDYLNKALKLGIEVNSFEMMKDSYNYLSKTDSILGNFEKAYVSKYWAYAYQDSMNKENYKNQIADLETKYNTEKVEKENEIQKLLISEQDTKSRNQKIVIYSLFIIVLGAIIFTIILIRLINDKKEANRTLSERNYEILQQQEEITTQRDEIEIHRDQLNEKHKLVLHQKKEILDSIYYAERIQHAALPPVELLNSILPEYFIFFKPRDIVSGDFYWAKKINQYVVVAAADCTGHGVPGGFMSMLGISFLNEIIAKKEITKANQVLENLRTYVKHSLNQTGKSGETKDGMDIALCIIDTTEKKLQFAGANNPMFYIKNGELIVYEPTRNPIGIYIMEKSFINHEFEYINGEQFYLFTDGYVDQFGGENKKKFMVSNFKKLILENHSKTMDKQNQIIENTFLKWKHHNKQIDDILVIGIKL